jgi:hypothetical protein
MAYSSDDIVEPFWAEYSSTASGRDPLAIQVSSVTIYTKMVVGITNTTNRIRYNGFFCWIFDKIGKNILKANSLQEQIRYSRRAELILAYIMVKNFPDVTGVSGSDYPSKNLISEINLQEGADWENKKLGGKVYWQNSQGIFGQYFNGVMRELKLVNHPNKQLELNVYTLTENGQRLAEAFKGNIPTDEEELFWQSVYQGYISEENLINLKSFALHIIPEGSEEMQIYRELMLGVDDRKLEPTFNRRNTIKLLLNTLKDEPEGIENLVSKFLQANYNECTEKELINDDTVLAWYLFEMNELLHVTFEHFHACFLYSIETYPVMLDEYINDLMDQVNSVFSDNGIVTKEYSVRDYFEKIADENVSVYDYFTSMSSNFRKGNFGNCIIDAVNVILGVYNNGVNKLNLLEEFAKRSEYNFNRPGYSIELFQYLIEDKWELTIDEYIKAIIVRAINIHTFSSYSKTKIGQSLVHNYMIEGNMVWRLRETLPSRTSPRLQNALQFISDIGWVKQEGKKSTITEVGLKIIQE